MASKVRINGGENLHSLPSDYICFDLETTGVNPHIDRVFEIGAVKVKDLEVVETFSILIEVDRYIPPNVSRLTGVRNVDLIGEHTEEDAMSAFSQFIGDSVLLAYNAPFDLNMIYLAFERIFNKPLANDYVDGLEIAHRALPYMKKHKLEIICEELGVVNEQGHRALQDAYATHDCYLKMRSILLDDYTQDGYSSLFRKSNNKCRSTSGGKSSKSSNSIKYLADDIVDLENMEYSPFNNATVVFTAEMEHMVRKEARHAVEELGGRVTGSVSRRTDFLVIGDAGYKREIERSTKLDTAYGLIAEDIPITILSETDFLEMIMN